MDDSTWIWIALAAVAAVLVILAIVVAVERKRRHHRLREQFGAEYDRVVDTSGRRGRGEKELEHRIERRDALDIRPLAPEARERYHEQWTTIQTRFVEEPGFAVEQADTLVRHVMMDRGYPVDDFEEQADLISVDHPRIVEDYRGAHEVATRNRVRSAGTEELRNALLRYRSLFDALLETSPTRQ